MTEDMELLRDIVVAFREDGINSNNGARFSLRMLRRQFNTDGIRREKDKITEAVLGVGSVSGFLPIARSHYSLPTHAQIRRRKLSRMNHGK